MKVVGLLSWYEESPSWLAAAITSASPILDHIVALDGAYGLFPHAAHHPRSGAEQAEAIHEAAYAANLGVTVHVPNGLWYGNEVEKRGYLFQLGEQVTEPGDWYAIIDADELVRQIPEDFRANLEATEFDAAEVAYWERKDVLVDPNANVAAQSFDWDNETTTPVRKFFRALRGLRPVGNHFTYVTPTQQVLWAASAASMRVPALRDTNYVIEHRNLLRPQHRRKQAREYYNRREETRAEQEPCWRCGQEAEFRYRPAFVNWRRDDDGLLADPVMICERCIERVGDETEDEIRALGADPNRVVRVP